MGVIQTVEALLGPTTVTRDDVYREYGKAAQLAQLIETELGTLLFAHEGIQQRAYVLESWEAGRGVLAAIDKHTLGKSLHDIKDRYNLLGDIEPVFDTALVARNYLAHDFFRKHGVEISSEPGCEAMVADLQRLQAELQVAYRLARDMAEYLVQEAERLVNEHNSSS